MADDVSVGRAVQAMRLARNLRQLDVATRAGVSAETVSRLERGLAEGMTVRSLRAISRALGMPPVVTLGWRGPEVDRLRDELHAAMVERVTASLRQLGWDAVPEHSFSHYGERGSVDVLGWHAASRALLIVETKTRLWDLQDTLATLDRKRRLMPRLAAATLGWRASCAGTVLVMPDTRARRRAVERHSATFEAALPARQIEVRRWLAAPGGDLRGIWFLNISHQAGTRQRSRRHRARRSGHDQCIQPLLGDSGSPTPLREARQPAAYRLQASTQFPGVGGSE